MIDQRTQTSQWAVSFISFTSIAGGPFGPSQLVHCAPDGDAIKRAPRDMCRCPYLRHPLLRVARLLLQ
jgi:hypothetical protein